MTAIPLTSIAAGSNILVPGKSSDLSHAASHLGVAVDHAADALKSNGATAFDAGTKQADAKSPAPQNLQAGLSNHDPEVVRNAIGELLRDPKNLAEVQKLLAQSLSDPKTKPSFARDVLNSFESELKEGSYPNAAGVKHDLAKNVVAQAMQNFPRSMDASDIKDLAKKIGVSADEIKQIAVARANDISSGKVLEDKSFDDKMKAIGKLKDSFGDKHKDDFNPAFTELKQVESQKQAVAQAAADQAMAERQKLVITRKEELGKLFGDSVVDPKTGKEMSPEAKLVRIVEIQKELGLSNGDVRKLIGSALNAAAVADVKNKPESLVNNLLETHSLIEGKYGCPWVLENDKFTNTLENRRDDIAKLKQEAKQELEAHVAAEAAKEREKLVTARKEELGKLFGSSVVDPKTGLELSPEAKLSRIQEIQKELGLSNQGIRNLIGESLTPAVVAGVKVQPEAQVDNLLATHKLIESAYGRPWVLENDKFTDALSDRKDQIVKLNELAAHDLELEKYKSQIVRVENATEKINKLLLSGKLSTAEMEKLIPSVVADKAELAAALDGMIEKQGGGAALAKAFSHNPSGAKNWKSFLEQADDLGLVSSKGSSRQALVGFEEMALKYSRRAA